MWSVEDGESFTDVKLGGTIGDFFRAVGSVWMERCERTKRRQSSAGTQELFRADETNEWDGRRSLSSAVKASFVFT